jgi:hypothetical protein
MVAHRSMGTGGGFGLFIGQNASTNSMTWEIRRYALGESATYTVVASATGLQGSGWFRLAYDASTADVTAGRWNGSAFTTDLTYDAASDASYLGTSDGGILVIDMQTDSSPTTEVTLDSLFVSGNPRGELPDTTPTFYAEGGPMTHLTSVDSALMAVYSSDGTHPSFPGFGTIDGPAYQLYRLLHP